MNLGRNTVNPVDFSMQVPQNSNLGQYASNQGSNFHAGNYNYAFSNQAPSNPSYYEPPVPPTAAPATTAASSSASMVVAAIVIVGVVGGCIAAAVVVIIQISNSSSSCSGFTCSSDGRCLPSSFQCDGYNDCDDGQDESDGCNSATTVTIPTDEQYSCAGSSGTIINKAKVCDGVEDCPGGNDEDRCIIAPNADDGGDIEIYSVSTNSYYKICGTADGWTDAKSDAVCVVLGFGSSQSSEEIDDSSAGISSAGTFSLHTMVQQTAATCTNNKVMRIHCVVPSCGVRTRHGRIVGGDNANITDHPWQISLQVKSTGSSFCGGTIVGDKWVVTAAHCLYGLSSFSNIRVVAGITDITEALDATMVYNIDTVTIHPDYSSSTYFMDVAIVKVTEDFSFSSNTQKVCLPPPGRTYPDNADVVASGWGSLSYGGSSPAHLQAVTVTLYNTNDCRTSSSYSSSQILSGMVCAGVAGGGKDSCQGDSGGPLIITTDSTTYYLVGATSWGVQCAASGYPGVYAEISYARSWIIRRMS